VLFLGLTCLSVRQKELKMEYYLWQLFNIEKDVTSTLAELEVDRATLQELNHEQEQLEAEIKALKKNQAVFTKEALLLDKKIAKKRGDLDKKVSYLWCLL
jgi:structural maintenance of chromosome 1